jgi:hypothetical protein
MKKMTIILASLITLAACSRQTNDLPPPVVAPVKASYFSKVTRYKDGRKPPVDTVWTLWLFSQQMVDSFAKYDGVVYLETNTFKEQGVLWTK